MFILRHFALILNRMRGSRANGGKKIETMYVDFYRADML
jgi:hypothetical protein